MAALRAIRLGAFGLRGRRSPLIWESISRSASKTFREADEWDESWPGHIAVAAAASCDDHIYDYDFYVLFFGYIHAFSAGFFLFKGAFWTFHSPGLWALQIPKKK